MNTGVFVHSTTVNTLKVWFMQVHIPVVIYMCECVCVCMNQGRSSEQRALSVMGQRLPCCLPHRQHGELQRQPAVPADTSPAQQNVQASNSHHPAGQQAGHGQIQVGISV